MTGAALLARELLRELTGERVAQLSAPTDKFPLPSPNPADIDAWVDLAMDQNLNLLAARFD